MATSIQDLRDAQARGIVKGVVNYLPGSRRPLNLQRREIDHFITDADVCNLFLLALFELQNNVNAAQDFSWFGISSIHGRPFQAWRGIDQNTVIATGQYPNPMGATTGEKGYCSHSSVLFPTWHRPYVAMMEQAICLRIHDIAQRYPAALRQRYVDAAYRFRMPYIDPFAARVLCEPQGPLSRLKSAQWRCGAPQILSSRVVLVWTPDNPNYPFTLPNPLYSYEFPTVRPPGSSTRVPMYAFDYNPPFQWENVYPQRALQPPRAPGFILPNQKTVRSPDPKTGASDHIRLEKAWSNLRIAGENVYSMLIEDNTYERFSNDVFWATPTRSTTAGMTDAENALIARCLEAFHDAVHSYFGFFEEDLSYNTGIPAGHMYMAEYSAFDPVFWLHHCNVDRLFAMWQYRNPTKNTFSQSLLAPAEQTFTEPLSYLQTQNSPLVPFIKANPGPAANMRFWTSADCMDTANLGYTYGEQFLTAKDHTAMINKSFLWLKTRGGRPSARSVTGFPVYFGNRHSRAPCLPSTVLIDGGSTFPYPYIRDPAGGQVRAVRSIDPAVSGVDEGLQQMANAAPGADSTEYVDASSYAAFINTNSIREWDVFMRFEKFSAGGGFAVHFSLGDLSKGPDWKLASNYVGEIFNFASTVGNGCQNCVVQRDADLMKAGIMSLTVHLQQYLASPGSLQPFSLKTLGQEDVIPFLTKHLQWLIIDYTGNVRQPTEITGFKVMVMTRVFHPPASEDVVGTWDAYEQAVEITHNKTGGLSHGESF